MAHGVPADFAESKSVSKKIKKVLDSRPRRVVIEAGQSRKRLLGFAFVNEIPGRTCLGRSKQDRSSEIERLRVKVDRRERGPENLKISKLRLENQT